jgi:hypothetical protein
VDDVAGDLGGVFAIGTALLPTTPSTCATPADRIVGGIHYACAGCFFLVLAFFALVLFRKTGGNPTPRKRQRNVVYAICGSAIILCIVLIALLKLLVGDDSPIDRIHPVFWLEAIALWAFGWSWFIKGESLLKD